MMTAANVQLATAIVAFLTGLIGLALALRNLKNFPMLIAWFKSRATLIADRDRAARDLAAANVHVSESRQSVNDLRASLDAVRETNEQFSVRLERIEKMRPINDALLDWTPAIYEYVNHLEMAAKAQNVDLGGRQMPPLPLVLVEYFRTRKIER